METKEKLIQILTQEIEKQTSPTGSFYCDENGVPFAVNEITLLQAVQSHWEELSYEDYQCYLCRDKRENPVCECCGVCPNP